MTANNSTKNNVAFFFVSGLKIVYDNNYQSFIAIPWIREEKYVASLLIWRQNHSKLHAKFHRKFNYDNYPQKRQIYRWGHKSQATGSVNHINKEAENLRSGRNLTARCPDNVDMMRDSVESVRKSSFENVPNLVFYVHRWKESSAVPMYNPHQV